MKYDNSTYIKTKEFERLSNPINRELSAFFRNRAKAIVSNSFSFSDDDVGFFLLNFSELVFYSFELLIQQKSWWHV